MLDNFLIAASLANLMLMWEWLNAFHPAFLIFNIHSVPPEGIAAFSLVFLLYFAAFFVLLRLAAFANHAVSRLSKFVLFCGLLIPWVHIRNFYHLAVSHPYLFSPTHFFGDWGSINPLKYVLLLGVGLFLYLRFETQLYKFSRALLLILFPFFFLTFGNLFWKHFSTPTEEKEPPALSYRTDLKQKTLWIIFDAFDYSFSFKWRDKETKLTFPEIDRFKSESFTFSHAIPPTPMTTYSVTSYLLGKTVISFDLYPYESATETFLENGETVRLGEQQTLFKKAKGLGASIGVIGWHIPYCPLFKNQLDYCVWFSPTQWPYEGGIQKDTHAAFRHSLFLKTSLSTIRRQIYKLSVEKSLNLIEQGLPNLTFLHFPVPHFPGIQAGADEKWVGREDKTIEDYYANLKFADEALGKIRAALEKKNEWDTTTVVVTSDHWLRYAPEDYVIKYGDKNFEIPLMIKFPHTNTFMEYHKPVPTLDIADFLLGTLNGKISTQKDLVQWADLHAESDREKLIQKTVRARTKINNETGD